MPRRISPDEQDPVVHRRQDQVADPTLLLRFELLLTAGFSGEGAFLPRPEPTAPGATPRTTTRAASATASTIVVLGPRAAV